MSTLYIKTLVTEELPKLNGKYFCYLKPLNKNQKSGKESLDYDINKGFTTIFGDTLNNIVDSWLKPLNLSLPELMEEYAKWMQNNFDNSHDRDGKWRRLGTGNYYSSEEVSTEFLKSKNIIVK